AHPPRPPPHSTLLPYPTLFRSTLVAKIGENLGLRRANALEVNDGVVASYIHNTAADGMGKIGVLVALESSGDKARLNDLGRKVRSEEHTSELQSREKLVCRLLL